MNHCFFLTCKHDKKLSMWSNLTTFVYIAKFSRKFGYMDTQEENFLNLVDNFVLETKDPAILAEISQLDREARALNITFYDMCCVVLKQGEHHKTLIAEFRTYMSLRKAATFLV